MARVNKVRKYNKNLLNFFLLEIHIFGTENCFKNKFLSFYRLLLERLLFWLTVAWTPYQVEWRVIFYNDKF